MLFFILYIYSSTRYPGGSQADLSTTGYDWVHNYWCNLMNEKAMNGQINPARPFAVVAMITLCSGLMVFFVQFARRYSENTIWKRIITFGGVLSMIFAMLIFTKHHDLMTTLSSIAGIFVVIGIIKAIYQSDMMAFKISGLFCILLLAINNYIYYTEHYIQSLPLLQKFTFAVVLIWIVGLNHKMINTDTSTKNIEHGK